jgi:16S rRNA G1207 methylase RsmC
MTPLVRPQERLLLDLIPELPSGRLLCNTAGRGQFAAAYAQQHAQSSTGCWFLDLYQRNETRQAFADIPPNLDLVCSADPPESERDLIAWASSKQGDGELTREMLQLGHDRLIIGGRFIAATDNPRDQWLNEQLQRLFAKVTRRPSADGVVYLATKTQPLRKHKNYAAEFAFREGDRLIHLRTRPGVFSHRELDGGARALIKTMHLQPAARVLDLGCGSGAVGIAAALRGDDVQVHAIDSNPRAIEAAAWSAERNAVASRITTALDCDGSSVAPGNFDFVLANPPYYSNFRLARLFLDIALKALRPGGELLIVTKSPDWYLTALGDQFRPSEILASGGYSVIRACTHC